MILSVDYHRGLLLVLHGPSLRFSSRQSWIVKGGVVASGVLVIEEKVAWMN